MKLSLKNKDLLPERKLTIKEKLTLFVWLIVLVVIPITLLILPVDYFDSGDSICLSVVLANRECYACGMTRGIMHLIHFDFTAAWEFNRLSFVVAPLAVFSFGLEFLKFLRNLKTPKEKQKSKP